MNDKPKGTDANSSADKKTKHNKYTDISGVEIIAEENFRVMSPGRMVAKRFFRSKLSVIGLCMIIFVFLFSFVGPLIVNVTWGYGETQVFKIERISSMVTTASFEAADGKDYNYYDESQSHVYFKAPISWTMARNGHQRVRYLRAPDVRAADFTGDIIPRRLSGDGARRALRRALRYFGKWVDQLIMRIVDIFFCLPGLPILLILSATIASIDAIPPEHRIYYLMGFLTFIGWAGTARLVRGQILMLREQEYMMAAETTGIPARKKIFKHLVPNVMPQLIVTMTLGLGGIILYESTLSYLGLGVPFPRAAWGSMIALADPSKGQEILANYPNMLCAAGLLIIIAVLGFSFIGDGLRDAFDPRMKR
jgi:peptide/nickel transport system permease protein